jgi:hypothetical protein
MTRGAFKQKTEPPRFAVLVSGETCRLPQETNARSSVGRWNNLIASLNTSIESEDVAGVRLACGTEGRFDSVSGSGNREPSDHAHSIVVWRRTLPRVRTLLVPGASGHLTIASVHALPSPSRESLLRAPTAGLQHSEIRQVKKSKSFPLHEDEP